MVTRDDLLNSNYQYEDKLLDKCRNHALSIWSERLSGDHQVDMKTIRSDLRQLSEICLVLLEYVNKQQPNK